ncbi:hypothetical protein PIB30_053293 [Stylosanthes scabra]|uniref:Uncharacterized protein n=1 Tax=Stylosanthes scabra TaxID=79078 RepID=A0ABU6VIN0_9FABA|nr:hypothetical protein [Stylosanthes scabra]
MGEEGERQCTYALAVVSNKLEVWRQHNTQNDSSSGGELQQRWQALITTMTLASMRWRRHHRRLVSLHHCVSPVVRTSTSYFRFCFSSSLCRDNRATGVQKP